MIKQHIKVRECIFICSLLFLGILSGCKNQSLQERSWVSTLEENYIQDLNTAIEGLDNLSVAVVEQEIIGSYRQSRNAFKSMEPLLHFLDTENYKFLNAPNISKIEEEDVTDVKERLVSGYQVLEELITSDSMDREEIKRHANITASRLSLIKNNVNTDFLKKHHLLWMLRDGFLRVATTGITGFDSPGFNASLEESILVYQALERYVNYLAKDFKDPKLKMKWESLLAEGQQLLKADFDTFDRYGFIKNNTQELLKLWRITVEDLSIDFPFELALNDKSESFFSEETFNLNYFSQLKNQEFSEQKLALGERLFNDNRLSEGNTMSCATCHSKGQYFTDGKKIAFDGGRNTPSIYYAGLQKAFFYDARSGSLEGQIVSVLESEQEFHSNSELMFKKISEIEAYETLFEEVYKDGLNEYNIRNAMATYVLVQNPFNSKLDRAMNDLAVDLNEQERLGFNLFTGKAQCATCHFAPIFNGLVPTKFAESEMELIGVPATKDTIQPNIDGDLGRYYVFNTEEKKHFFKTPTVRNIEKTAPYMHNGVYETLEEVVAFYNRGGGVGLGIDLPYQTLPSEPLGLNTKEVQALVAFMKTLTDEIVIQER